MAKFMAHIWLSICVWGFGRLRLAIAEAVYVETIGPMTALGCPNGKTAGRQGGRGAESGAVGFCEPRVLQSVLPSSGAPFLKLQAQA